MVRKNIRKAFGILIIVASISVLIFQPVQAKSEKSKILFSDNFDENNLNNWLVNSSGNADAIADNGAMRMRVYKCSNVFVSKDLGNVNGNITLDFDYAKQEDGWGEYTRWKLFVDDTIVASNGNGFYPSPYGSSAGHVTQNLNVKGKTKLQYSLEQSWACSYGDHWNTYYWIDIVNHTNFARIKLGNILTTNLLMSI